jgi:hypothetical protein
VSPIKCRIAKDLLQCCHAHSNCSAWILSVNPPTTTTNCQGRPHRRVRKAPPFLSSPLCCRKRRCGFVCMDPS